MPLRSLPSSTSTSTSTSTFVSALVFVGLTVSPLASVGLSSASAAEPSVAQTPPVNASPLTPASGTPGPSPDSPPPLLAPPALLTHPDAPYPDEARRQHVEGNVGLELNVDAEGHVSSVRVVTPAGHGFDESATETARRFIFQPARENGVAIPAIVQFTYEFHLPDEPAAPPATASPTPPALSLDATRAAGDDAAHVATQNDANQSTLVLASRPLSAASSFAVQDREFALRPIGSVQDVLRVTPGLVLVQHAGGGKANQYFLRGFDADHGTDLALSIDGIPINFVSHAHGQGFADTNFIIPEVVERVEITKGPYFAAQGDFATAGAVNMVSRTDFDHSSAGAGFVVSPGHGAPGYRGLAIASPRFTSVPLKATFAAEIGRTNGPFDNRERWDRYKLFNKLTYAPSPEATLTIGQMSYAGNWRGSGQLPDRAVERGLVSRWGSLDPDEGGNSARHQAFVQYRLRPTENSELKVLGYLGTYRFNLTSNFTIAFRDPDNGDGIEQVDRRTFYGAKLSYRVVRRLGDLTFDTTIGGEGRNDDIHQELWNVARRQHLAIVRNNGVHQSSLGAYLNEEVTPFRWLRANVGARADLLSFAVDDRLGTADPASPRSGVDAAHQLSPKASLVATPVSRPGAAVDLYANYGHGFHSNDVRGRFTEPQVSPLARAVGSELGSRARFFERWDVAAALWQLHLDNETVWIGDEGTTEVGAATVRRGVEVDTRVELLPWLAADLDVTFTKSRFREGGESNQGLALAPKQTWSGGLSARHALGAGAARAGLRFYGIGDRPASDDGELVARGFTQFDMHLGYRHRWFDVALDVENLFNGSYRAAQFATTSRLRNEPTVGGEIPAGFTCGSRGRLAPAPMGAPATSFGGCEDVAYTPAYPLTVRLMATLFLD